MRPAAGVLLLGKIVLQEDGLNRHSNFQSFPTALLTLFRVAVGDDWTSIMSVSHLLGWLA